MGDVYILGAGFSRAISKEMPLLKDFCGHFLSGGYDHPASIGEDLREVLRSRPELDDDFEMLLTFLSERHPWQAEEEYLEARSLFVRLSREIGHFLHDRTSATLRELSAWPPWLIQLVGAWDSNRSTVITLNYDVLVEIAAARSGIHCGWLYPIPLEPAWARNASRLAGGRKRSFILAKLHGSINWYYSGNADFRGEPLYCRWGLAELGGQVKDAELLADENDAL